MQFVSISCQQFSLFLLLFVAISLRPKQNKYIIRLTLETDSQAI